MRLKTKSIGFICGACVGGLALVAVVLLMAARHVPGFYEEALSAEPAALREANDELLQRATALTNDIRRHGRWNALFTADQINGWLSVDLVQNHPELLDEGFSEPRIRIESGRVTLACRYHRGPLETVVSARFEIYLAEPNVMALRIDAARAGALPVSIKTIVDGVSQAAERMNLRVEWRQAGGDPVALITLPATHDARSVYRLDALQLRQGELYVTGRTEPWSPGESPESVPAAQPPLAELKSKENVQR